MTAHVNILPNSELQRRLRGADPVWNEALSLASRAGKAEARVEQLEAIIGLFRQAMAEEGAHARNTMLAHADARASMALAAAPVSKERV